MGETSAIITAEVNRLHGCSSSLRGLANAFERTGNHRVGEELHELADAMHEAAQAIHDAYYDQRSTETRQSIANSERFVGSILKGLLSGADPKDACIAAMPHHFDRDIIEAKEPASTPSRAEGA